MINLVALVDENMNISSLEKLKEDHNYSATFFSEEGGLLEDLETKKDGTVVFLSESKSYDIYKICSYISVNFPLIVIILVIDDRDLNIKKAMYAGATDVMYLPVEEIKLQEVLGNALSLLRIKQNSFISNSVKPTANGKVFTVCSAKGGVGKTTISSNLAAELVKNNKKVAIIDLDLQFGDVDTMFDIKPKRTIYEWTKQIINDDQAGLLDYTTQHSSGVYILSAPLRPEFSEVITGEHIERIIDELKKDFHYIVIDTPPGLVETTLVALEHSDEIIMVTYPDITSVKGSKIFIETLKTIGVKEQLKVILNRFTKGTGINPSQIGAILGEEVSVILPSSEKVVVNSINTGIPFTLSNSTASISKKINNLTAIIADSTENSLKRSLFTRFSLVNKGV